MTARSYGTNPLASQADTVLAWIVNICVVLLLPFRLGLSGASFDLFVLYCVVCGSGLTLGEDWRYAAKVFVRPDVRGYLFARIATVFATAAIPFIAARLVP